MNIKWKRLMSLLCVSVLTACAALSGCGSDKDKKETENNTPQSTQEQSNASTANTGETTTNTGETTTINWYRAIFNTYADAEGKAVEAAINEYLEPLIGVKVNMTVLTHDNYPTKLNLALAGGEDVDVFWTSSWSGAASTEEIVRNNAALDITELLDDYPLLLDSMPKLAWQSSAFEGKNYFIPNYKGMSEGYSFITPKAVAEQAGMTREDFDKVESILDLEPYLEKISELNLRIPLTFRGKAYGFTRFFMDKFDSITNYAGIKLDGDQTKVVNILESEEYENYVTKMYEWNQKGYISEGDATEANANIVEYAHMGDFGLMPDETKATVEDTEIDFSESYNCEVIAIPVTEKYIGSNGALGSCYAINAQSKRVDASMRFLGQLMTDTTLADFAAYGIEGEQYTRGEDNKVTFKPDVTYLFNAWSSTNITVASVPSSSREDTIIIDDAAAIVRPTSGFRFDRTKVDAQYTALQSVVDEYMGLLEEGFLEPEKSLAEYRSRMKEAGIDTVIAEMQAQYDEFLANKQ